MRLGFAYWTSAAPSGGNLYDRRLIDGLGALGVAVTDRRIGGFGETIRDRDVADLEAALRAQRIALVDGILACRVPEVVAAAVAAGHRVVVVVHHFATDDPELDPGRRATLAQHESTALHAASGVLCTSQFAAEELRRRYGLAGLGVAPPGADAAELAPGSRTTGVPRLLSLGSLTPVKDQLCLVAALAQMTDLAWTASLVGGDMGDPDYAARVRDRVGKAGLDARVQVPGARTGSALDAEWAAADLLVQPSRSETYGIVVLEALARGIPALVMAGTGGVEALAAGRAQERHAGPGAGAIVRPHDPDALAAAVRRWLGDPELASAWRSEAQTQRKRLPDWSATCTAALDYVRGLP